MHGHVNFTQYVCPFQCLKPWMWLSPASTLASTLDAHASSRLQLHNCICNGQAGSSPIQRPYVPTLPCRPLWAQAPVAFGCSLFNRVTPVWEQPGAQDTGRQLSELFFFFFYQQSQTTAMGLVAWLCAFLIPPTTILAPVTNGLWFKTSSYPLEDLLGWRSDF